MRFSQKLQARMTETRSALCVGLDPRPQTENVSQLADWLQGVVEETVPYAAAYKPNIAYFEAMGIPGFRLLENLIELIPCSIPVILDVKRGDIGETQKYYAKAYFEYLNVDAVTLNPFMGYDTLEPFLSYAGKAAYLLTVTSNPGSADIERQTLADGRSVYQLVGDMVRRAQQEGALTDLGMVVGLTNASHEILDKIPDAPMLIPGFGAQGGELTVLSQSTRQAPSVVNVSRGILYAEPELSFAQKAENYALRIREALHL